ncbi:hypothetical protein Cni_G04720 [Canna indica]|uniref:Peptidase A1 domain-containing protein n=1 Tax=Canna indica TaxID=4628 RepID=A0AAQ3JVB1_9LILI|nr:hypothetical protein Cni_G04720 [Canna indica]
MAAENPQSRRRFLLFLFSVLMICLSPTMSHRQNLQLKTGSRITTTTTFNVSASLAEARRAVSFDTTSSDRLLPSPSSSSSISSYAMTLPLFSRDFFPSADGYDTQRHRDYEALTLERFARDAARVRSIASRLALAVGGMSSSDLNALLAEEKVVWRSARGWLNGSIVSGGSTGSGEYFSRVRIGTPGTELYMVLDTGSDVNWIQCLPCADCYEQVDPIFDPSASSSYAPLSCQSSQCRSLNISSCVKTARKRRCLYQSTYGDGSYSIGEFVKETITFGSSVRVSGVAIGCGFDNGGNLKGAAGLLGLGGGPLSFISQIAARSFSYCLVDRDSDASSILNISVADSATREPVTAPLVRNPRLSTFRYVEVTGMSVGGKMLPVPPSEFAVDEGSGKGGVVVDSGTVVTRLSPPVYTALRDAFRAAMGKKLPMVEGRFMLDTCYNLSGRTSVKVPTVMFHFPRGQALPLLAKNCLVSLDGAGTYCLAFAPTTVPFSVIGNIQQQGIRVSYDLANNLVGFAPNAC